MWLRYTFTNAMMNNAMNTPATPGLSPASSSSRISGGGGGGGEVPLPAIGPELELGVGLEPEQAMTPDAGKVAGHVTSSSLSNVPTNAHTAVS
jgi:hypothetical protein